jgi:hypothetical protein
VLRCSHDIAYLLLYVDDIVLTGSIPGLLQHIIGRLRDEFTVKDMGELRFFLGIDVKRQTYTGWLLSVPGAVRGGNTRPGRHDQLPSCLDSRGLKRQASCRWRRNRQRQ